MRRSVAAMALLAISGCAPPGYHFGQWSLGDPKAAFTVYPNDACQRRELRTPGAVQWVNSLVGTQGGPSGRVVTIENVSGPAVDNPNPLSCHATLRLENGGFEEGTLTFFSPGNDRPLVVSWESDFARSQRLRRNSLDNWKSYPGDIASWSGIPPLPRSASEVESSSAPVHCSIGDAAGHMVAIWTTKSDCSDWISEARRLSASGPTPVQLRNYRISKCIERLSAAGYIQSRSGEELEICSAAMPYQ